MNTSLENTAKQQRPNPITKTWFIPRILFFWVIDIINKSKKTPWTQEMNYDLPKYDQVKRHKERIIKHYADSKNLLKAILMAFRNETFTILVAQIALSLITNYGLRLTSSAFNLLSVLPLYHNMENLERVGLKLMAGTLLSLASSIISSYFGFFSLRVSLAIRSALFSIMQDKIMGFSTLNSETVTQGLIADLIQVDVVFLNSMYLNIFLIFGSTIGTIISLGFFAYSLGFYLTLMYIVVLFFLTGIYHACYKIQAWIRKHYLEAKDKRMSLLRNVLENVDYVKINGMENYFCLEMYERREGEISWLKGMALIQGFQYAVLQVLNSWIPCMIFNAIWMFFPVFDMNLTKFLDFYNYNGNLVSNLSGILSGYSYYLNMMVSIRRIDSFLSAEDKDNLYLRELSEKAKNVQGGQDLALKVVDGNFRWRYTKKEEQANVEKQKARARQTNMKGHRGSAKGGNSSGESESVLLSQVTDNVYSVRLDGEDTEEEEFMLKNVNLSIRNREKIGVIGRSSSGTSSLIYAMIGEMVPVGSAKVLKSGSMSYLSQERWLMGGSVKENILLGKDYDEKLMRGALEAADLLVDLDQFTDRIDTILSDNGDSVSGGQRARIALARCFYQE